MYDRLYQDVGRGASPCPRHAAIGGRTVTGDGRMLMTMKVYSGIAADFREKKQFFLEPYRLRHRGEGVT